MKAVVCDSWGDPEKVLQVRELPTPTCGRGQVRVRMLAVPINPSDLLMIRGEYGRQPNLPAIPGYEGVGIVEEGRGLLGWRVKGKRVAVLNGASGNWAEQVVVPARQAVPIPDELSDEQAASFFINPATALVMTRHVLQVPKGDWLLQTAAGSALGRMVIRLGQLHGFRTINVIRRPDQEAELLGLGGTAVIVQGKQPLAERVKELTGGEGVRYAIDAVGGETGSEVVKALAPHGRMLVYGTLAGQPMQVNARDLMVGQKRVEGFWLSEWVRDQGVLTMLGLFRQIGHLLKQGVLTTEVATSFPIDQVHEAVRLAATPGRKGKVLLRLGQR